MTGVSAAAGAFSRRREGPGAPAASVSTAATLRRGPLVAAELAEACLLGDLTVLFVVAGTLLPFAGLLQAAAAAPLAVLARRRRFRAVAVASVCAALLSALLTGLAGPLLIAIVAPLGIVCARAHRRRWRPVTLVLGGTLAAWAANTIPTLAALAVLTQLRRLTLRELADAGTTLSRLLRFVAGASAARRGDHFVHLAVTHWPLTAAVVNLGFVATCVAMCGLLVLPALDRLAPGFLAGSGGAWTDSAGGRLPGNAAGWSPPVPEPGAAGGGGVDAHPVTGTARPDPANPRSAFPAPGEFPAPGAFPAPVPTRLRGVWVFGTDGQVILRDLDLEIGVREFLAVTGANGAGKTTLMHILAGRPPDAGTVERPGRVALGHPGGTAVIAQQPDSQVLGARVRDDLAWGLPPGSVDTDALLAEVGLTGYADRDTTTLSGGELQRLALAAALARRPVLVLSDESTAMLDPAGRTALVDLLHQLPRRFGCTVVHVTHRVDEIAPGDRVVHVVGGRVSSVRIA